MAENRTPGPAARKVRMWFVFFLVLLFLAGVGGIVWVLWQNHHADRYYDSLAENYSTEISGAYVPERSQDLEKGLTASQSGEEQTEKSETIQKKRVIDFSGLQDLNHDIVGWISQENGDIDYPILWSGDNETYLRKLPDQTSAPAGSIFLEQNNRPDFTDAHLLIYGHNMRDGSMFATLKAYREEDYYKEHRFFMLYTPEGSYRYQVFAWEEAAPDDEIYTIYGQAEQTWDSFVHRILELAEYDTGVDISEAQQILTMSTCTSGENRFVVHAVRVADET